MSYHKFPETKISFLYLYINFVNCELCNDMSLVMIKKRLGFYYIGIIKFLLNNLIHYSRLAFLLKFHWINWNC